MSNPLAPSDRAIAKLALAQPQMPRSSAHSWAIGLTMRTCFRVPRCLAQRFGRPVQQRESLRRRTDQISPRLPLHYDNLPALTKRQRLTNPQTLCPASHTNRTNRGQYSLDETRGLHICPAEFFDAHGLSVFDAAKRHHLIPVIRTASFCPATSNSAHPINCAFAISGTSAPFALSDSTITPGSSCNKSRTLNFLGRISTLSLQGSQPTSAQNSSGIS